MTRYEWVAARRAEGFPTVAAARAAQVSTSAFVDWCRRRAAGPTPGEVEQARLVAVMRGIHDDSDGTYGSPRMTVCWG
ncbi:hypothetical protein [Candidatus Poriferisocius sp.]|uniref:hypothetical protein n=1 Tax=Candidatus Poriferisocius sp. TaxID=3101276 RepID=UPI003B5933FD